MNETLPPIAWLLYGDRSLASSRLQGYLIDDELRARGFRSRVAVAPPFPVKDVPWPVEAHGAAARVLGAHVVVFQKLGGRRAEALRDALAAAGAATVYVHCDDEPANELPLRCDAIVCSSRHLARCYEDRGAHTVTTIPDPAEAWIEPEAVNGTPKHPGRLRLVWIGYRRSWETVDRLRKLLAGRGLDDYELVTVSNHPDADVQWSPEAERSIVAEADIGVVPVRSDSSALAKSSNRVVALMAQGLPVVADRLPAYEEVIVDGANGFLCDGVDDWVRALEALRSAEVRRQVARAGRESIDPRFRLSTIVDEWIDVFQRVAPAAAAPAEASSREERRLRAFLHAEAELTYAQEGLGRNLRTHEVLTHVQRALRAAAAGAAPRSQTRRIVGTLGAPVAARIRDATRRRLGG